MFAVGEAVRVLSSDKSVSYRAIVSLCGADDTYDVILAHSAAGQNDEEVGVQRSRISPIEAFEKIADTDSTEAETLKSYGNTLFTLKDYSATMEYYKKAITVATQSQPAGDAFTVGQSVLVSFRDSIDYQSGIVSDVDVSLSTADVMFDDSAMDEEVAVPFTRLLPLAVSSKDRLLQRSVYMNMARSVLKREQKGWAIKYCSLAIAIAKHFQSTTESLDTSGVTEVEVNKMLADGYYFRAKALLMACRPKFANQVPLLSLHCVKTLLIFRLSLIDIDRVACRTARTCNCTTTQKPRRCRRRSSLLRRRPPSRTASLPETSPAGLRVP